MAKKILLIEYEPRYLDRIRGFLAGKDFDLVVAKDGDEGLEVYQRSRPDLVLISSVLPKLRTPDVIRGMQKSGPTPPILLMMSGYKGKNRIADAQRVGATSILEKPFAEDVFLTEMSNALAGVAPPPMALSDTGSLLSSDDIFSDVLSGMDGEAAAAPAPAAGTDPGIQKKLEQTLSGILPGPKKSGPTANTAVSKMPGAAAPSAPAPKPAPVPASTVRLETSSLGKLTPPPSSAPPAPSPAAPAPKVTDSQRLRSVDASVDKMLTDTLSGLKAGRSGERASGQIPKATSDIAPVKPAPAPEKPAERVPEKTDKVAAPKPAPAPAPSADAPRPAPPARPTASRLEVPMPSAASVVKPQLPTQAPTRPVTTTTASGPGAFGRYQLLEKIAAGGMAEVYKARMRGEEGFEKIVAIKRILPHMADNDDFITMFIDEAKLAAQLTHNNIIHIYDLGKVDAYHYIAMEYVEGKDLRSILKLGAERGLPLPPELALLIASKIANALDYAHRRMGLDGQELNLIHRDVSPQNILIGFEGDIKLCDFGIAKATTKVSQTQTGALKGKLQYMSPEQAWGKKLDRRTDIFSLGIVLFEMLTGERLFTGDTDLTILEQVRDARVVPPSSKNDEIPRKIDQIVLKALGKSPQDRYQNASEMEKEINSVLYSYQPTPGPADLAIYMHRLMEASPVVSDEQIDAAFASAAAAPMPEPVKKGKGLVISKKAAPEKSPEKPAERHEEKAPVAALEVSSPALAIGPEPAKSRTGLFVGIGLAAAALVGVGAYLAMGRGGATTGPQAVPTPAPATAGTTAPDVPPATVAGPAVEPTKILDKAALDAALKAELAKKEKELRDAAAKGGPVATAPVAPVGAAPTQPPAVAFAPNKSAQPTAVPVPPTKAPEVVVAKPTPEPPKPTEPPKVAEAAPPAAPDPAPNVPPPSNQPIREGDLVGPGEGVVEPVLVRLGSFVLPPEARQISRQRGERALGTPVVMALITERGVVAETRVIKPSSYKFVDEAAVNALKSSKIEPATKNGVKVKMWKTFPIRVTP